VRELIDFVVTSTEFFESTSARKITSEYLNTLEKILPPDWSLEKRDIWLFGTLDRDRIPRQGFKIHVSGTPLNAKELLAIVVPECVKEGTAFKAVADSFLLTHLCSKGYNRGSAGKFITIYPTDLSTFRRLLEALDENTKHLSGPYILSDRRYKQSHVLFYRYGGFLQSYLLRVDGTKEPLITAPDGTQISDVRLPIYALPAWVDDPFERSASEQDDSPTLNNRYEIKSPIHYSNAGGIYKAVDTVTEKAVVIKEARPLTAYVQEGSGFGDATRFLEREYSILKKLEHLPFIPKPIELFREWEHLFLVEEFVDGIQLSSYRASFDMALSPFTLDAKRTANFCNKFQILGTKLIDAVTAIHEEGVLIGDISPYNVIVDPENLDITLIDFESAHDLKHSDKSDFFSAVWSTPGFRSPERVSKQRLTKADDFYALAMLLYSLILPVQSLFEIEPKAKNVFIDQIGAAVGLPLQIKRSIILLCDGLPDAARAELAMCSADRNIIHTSSETASSRQFGGNPNESDISAVLNNIKRYLLNTYDLKRTDRLWPADYSVFFTNPLSVGYGTCGTLLCLQDLCHEIPSELKSWLQGIALNTDSFPPGLYVGLSGIAWTQLELGDTAAACEVMRLAYSSPQLYDDPTLFWGIAGWGLASLKFHDSTQESLFLSKAIEAGEYLVSTAQEDDAGYCWKSILHDRIHFGLAYGASGIALFLLNLFRATAEKKFLEHAERAMAYEVANAIVRDEQMTWGRYSRDSLEEPYWLHGSGGIGSALIRFFAALQDPKYLDLAERAANAAFSRFCVLPSQFEGLSGIGEFMLDMHIFTGQARYRELAFEIAKSVLCYQIERPAGCAFPGRYLLRISNDYGYGTAGVGCFLNRLINVKSRRFHDLQAVPALIPSVVNQTL